jgi:hypothetical protein
VSPWAGGSLPITVKPCPGEGLDSWIEAYARRLRVTTHAFLAFIGLPRSRVLAMTLRLAGDELGRLHAASGLSREDLRAMTLERFDGVTIVLSVRRRGTARPPAWSSFGSYSRYCPQCLSESGGRWQLAWRQPWSFACARHGCLLEQECPGCRGPVRAATAITRTGGVFQPGLCGAAAGSGGQDAGRCGYSLGQVQARELPADGLVLAAQHELDAVLGKAGDDPDGTRMRLQDLYALGRRILTAISDRPGTIPPAARKALDEVGEIPQAWRPWERPDVRMVAVGTALARTCTPHPAPDDPGLLAWLAEAPGDLGPAATRPNVRAGAWRGCSPALIGTALAPLDPQLGLPFRVRYATAIPQPFWRPLTGEQASARMRGIPGRLWPSWTLRLVPGGDNHPGALARLRRSASALLLLPGTSITFPGAVAALAPAAAPIAKPVIPAGCPEQVLASVLAQLAWSLDRHGSPIDYGRRRRLFTPDTVLLDEQALGRLMKAEGHRIDDPVRGALSWHLLVALQGEVPDDPPASAVLRKGSGLALLTAPLHRFIRDQAAASLARHDISEPLSWEPPARWASCRTWPGTDIDGIDIAAIQTALAAVPSRRAAATRLPLPNLQLQLLCEAREIPCAGTAPDAPGRRRQQPKRVPRTGALSPAQLQASYAGRHASLAEIAALARCDVETVKRAIREAGIPLRQHSRRPLRGTITREWLHEQYTGRGRSAPGIARELGLPKNTVIGLLSRHGISKPAGTRASSPFAQLDVQLTPAMLAVSRSRNSLQRLRHVAAMPGQPSIGSAARHLSISRGTLGGQLRAMERTAGFRIIDRTSPLRATGEGATFLAEARRLLAELDQARATCHGP